MMRPHMRSMVALVAGATLAVLMLAQLTVALRSGAPTLACVNMRPLHGLHQPKPASASQFFVRQSALSYAPGENITVEIMTQSNERYFRGFMLQSYNPVNGKQIGHFVPTDEAQSMACASATHRNNQDKRQVTITWVAPESIAREGPAAAVRPPALGAFGNWLGLPTNGVQKRHLPTAAPTKDTSPVHQVRFRATIVVSYTEFYTGFESSELKFERFDYSPASLASAPSQARGMVNVAVAVSPRANTTAIAVASSSSKVADRLERPLTMESLRPLLAASEQQHEQRPSEERQLFPGSEMNQNNKHGPMSRPDTPSVVKGGDVERRVQRAHD